MNPQNEMGLQVLLLRQEFKCASCGYDYTPALKAVQEKAKGRNIDPSLNKFNYWVMKILKNQFKWHVPEERARQPEIDHIIPIGLDGQSLGFDNHQVLCRSCHLEKTKEDHAKIREFKKRK
jgi:rubredoxin